MSVPGVVESTLDGESVAAEVPLGGEDALYITPTRTLIYRAEGLLSDESVEEYPHDAERLTLKEGRRKTRFSLEYPIEGTKEFTIPSNRTEQAIHPVLAGIMNASGVTDAGETVVKTYRFSEMTLVITSERLVKHVGEVVWDEDYEEYHYADVTGLTFEEGSVATQIVLEVDGRQQRIKAPKEHAREVRERLTQALYSYYDVTSMDALLAAVAPDDEVAADDEVATDDEDAGGVAFGEGVDPLDADPPAPDDEAGGDAATEPAGATASDATRQRANDEVGRSGANASSGPSGNETRQGAAGASKQPGSGTEPTIDDAAATSETRASDEGDGSGFDFEDAGFEPAGPDADVDDAEALRASSPDSASPRQDIATELAELRQIVEQQNERLDKQRHAIERLVEELSRGR